jgi:MFS family permease
MKITDENQGSQAKTSYGWVVVAAGALMTCVAGAVFSLAVFLQPITEATGWSRAGVSGAMTLDFLAMGVGGFIWGALSDRYGARPVVLTGSVLLGLGLVLASQATSLVEFQLVYGLLVGLAVGNFMPPLIAAVTNWFDRHRALAVSLVSAGLGVAPMTMSPFASWLLTTLDWRSAQLTMGVLAALILVPASMLVRSPLFIYGLSAAVSSFV